MGMYLGCQVHPHSCGWARLIDKPEGRQALELVFAIVGGKLHGF